ncbi:sugar ABC transporter ATP-binding protein [Rubellimicrobium arenae]|uniref:sugar ABC transporter ATP-binding protein n=1 Tax=Rubellimicrobium arenae TaxID=2817372 RepID=UPI001FEDCFD2|nr:sugar ABC transporter ATP-binding protein [Rubellimicrobium arenae]
MLLSIRGLDKSFGGTPALSDVALDLRAGEVHALMGENGAGKSTLIRVLAGVSPADRMDARLDGAPLVLGSPADAARAGFRFVHQELNIVPTLSVAENIFLGRSLPRRLGAAVDWRRLNRMAGDALGRFGLSHIDPRQKAGRLGTGDRMLMRLASMLVSGDTEPRLFVMDEPTAALTHAESERLFAVIRDLRARGAAILYVSHRLDEVMALADRVTVLRDGRRVLTAAMAETGRAGIIRAMTGRDVTEAHPRRAAPARAGTVCRLEDVSAGRLSGLSFELGTGEILGVAGLENAGQSDLLHLLLGDGGRISGRAEVADAALPRSPSQAWGRGVAFVPRERRREGLMLGRSIVANTVLPHLGRLSVLGLARKRLETDESRRLAQALRLRHRTLAQPVRELSGGNQQKVVLARATLDAPKLLLLDEPTRGVDVGAREDIYATIRSLAAQGTGILLASTDLPELIGLSDRILILRDGRQVGLVATQGLDPEGLLSLIYGEARGAHE